MKKSSLWNVVTVCCLMSFSAVTALAFNNEPRKFYIGLKTGYTQFSSILYMNETEYKIEKVHLNIINDTYLGVLVGHDITKYLGFEVGYNNVGILRIFDDTISNWYINYGIDLGLKFNLFNFRKFINFYTKLGAYLSYSSLYKGENLDYSYSDFEFNEVTSLFNLGVDINLNKNLVTRLETQLNTLVDEEIFFKYCINDISFNLGLIYNLTPNVVIDKWINKATFTLSKFFKQHHIFNYHVVLDLPQQNNILDTNNIDKLNNIVNIINTSKVKVNSIEIDYINETNSPISINHQFNINQKIDNIISYLLEVNVDPTLIKKIFVVDTYDVAEQNSFDITSRDSVDNISIRLLS